MTSQLRSLDRALSRTFERRFRLGNGSSHHAHTRASSALPARQRALRANGQQPRADGLLQDPLGPASSLIGRTPRRQISPRVLDTSNPRHRYDGLCSIVRSESVAASVIATNCRAHMRVAATTLPPRPAVAGRMPTFHLPCCSASISRCDGTPDTFTESASGIAMLNTRASSCVHSGVARTLRGRSDSREALPLRPGTHERQGNAALYMLIYCDRSESREDFLSTRY